MYLAHFTLALTDDAMFTSPNLHTLSQTSHWVTHSTLDLGLKLQTTHVLPYSLWHEKTIHVNRMVLSFSRSNPLPSSVVSLSSLAAACSPADCFHNRQPYQEHKCQVTPLCKYQTSSLSNSVSLKKFLKHVGF